jgi:predicted PurR-regulated permease PerM
MARPLRTNSTERALVLLAGIVVSVVVIAVLYWAQRVLIPVALAIFFTFLLSPVVTQFQRWGLPRILAVLAAAVLASVVVLAIGWLVISQVVGLANDMPNYSETIRKKVEAVQDITQTLGLDRFEELARAVGIAGPPSDVAPGASRRQPPGTTPVPVVVEREGIPWLSQLPSYVLSVGELVAQVGMVIVLTIFMLLGREDLRNRFIRLVGSGHMTVTTKAVDDASQRLSRFLLAQATLNGTFGLAVAVALTLIGVQYAVLWGFLAGMLRYLPYIGSPIAALFPVALSLVQFDAWWPAVMVAVVILGLEALTGNVLEPMLYGRSIGVSAVALLVAAAFWTFLWGPIGLVLSCPLTVCLVVLGKYVPYLRFLSVLLGDQPALGEDTTFYQRLSAHDKEEAIRIALAHAKQNSPEKTYDDLLVPALVYAARDNQHGGLDAGDMRFVHDATRAVIADLSAAQGTLVGKEVPEALEDKRPLLRNKVRILGVAVRDDNDELGLEMLNQLLADQECELTILGPDRLSSEVLQRAADDQPAAVILAALPPGGQGRIRYLCKRLRQRFARLRIIVGRWGVQGPTLNLQKNLQKAGADQVRTTLLETRNDLVAWLPALAGRAEEEAHGQNSRQDQEDRAQVARGLR